MGTSLFVPPPYAAPFAAATTFCAASVRPEAVMILRRLVQDCHALHVPGGQAPVVDLMQDQEIGEILRHFHAHSKPTAMLCHGPIASVAGR